MFLTEKILPVRYARKRTKLERTSTKQGDIPMRVAVALSAVVFSAIFFLAGSVTAAETPTHIQDRERIARLPGAAHAKGRNRAQAPVIAEISDSVQSEQAQTKRQHLPAHARH